ncbi:MAG: hypothetical protein KAG97_00215, partial [Victivallales bacterium]|nr:hypothetical protein [Victivallales bacterium]
RNRLSVIKQSATPDQPRLENYYWVFVQLTYCKRSGQELSLETSSAQYGEKRLSGQAQIIKETLQVSTLFETNIRFGPHNRGF